MKESGSQDFAAAILDAMVSYGKAQFGDAVKAYWVYDGDVCPGCLKRPIAVFNHRGKTALSVNGFMYRERGVLIGYLLCGQCAQDVFRAARNGKTRVHEDIEKNLSQAYLRYLASLDA
jgi:hypothetical protein